MLDYLKVVIAACVFEAFIMALLPSGKMKNITRSIMSLLLILMLISPILDLIKTYILN